MPSKFGLLDNQPMEGIVIVGWFNLKSLKRWGVKPSPERIEQEFLEFWARLFADAEGL
jgi:hypothetical protein